MEGWVATADGAFVVDEPQGSPSWFPCNDSPRTRRRFDFHVTVPQGVTGDRQRRARRHLRQRRHDALRLAPAPAHVDLPGVRDHRRLPGLQRHDPGGIP